MQEGVVKSFNAARGFGFITPTNGGADVIFHVKEVKELQNEIHEGDQVYFEVQNGKKGLNAVNVRHL